MLCHVINKPLSKTQRGFLNNSKDRANLAENIRRYCLNLSYFPAMAGSFELYTFLTEFIRNSYTIRLLVL